MPRLCIARLDVPAQRLDELVSTAGAAALDLDDRALREALGRSVPADRRASTQQHPAVELLGPRQVAKTTLAKTAAANHPGAIKLNMERESDPPVLGQPRLILPLHRDQIFVLGEVQHLPGRSSMNRG